MSATLLPRADGSKRHSSRRYIFAAAVVAVAAMFSRAEPLAPARHATADPEALALTHRFNTDIKPLLAEHCYRCHGNGKHKGEMVLDRFSSLDSIQADRHTWQSVENAVQMHVMPPEERPQPSHLQIETIASFVESALAYCDMSSPRDPGRVMLHRLNRNEYNNTLRDLLGLDLKSYKPAEDFPADDTGYGFDNIADVLSVSPLLAEKYLAAAEHAVDKAIPSNESTARSVLHIVGAELQATAGGAEGNAWNLSNEGEVYKQRDFAGAADYEIRLRAEADQAGDEPARMTVRLDGKDVQTFDVKAVRGVPELYKVRVSIPGGSHRISAAFINDFYDEKIPDPTKRDRNLIVDELEIDGPLTPPQTAAGAPNRLIFVRPGNNVSDLSAATAVISRFASRAFRRPSTPDEAARLLKLYSSARAQGEGFVPAVKVAMTAVLVWPQFLFRIETDAPAPAGATAIRTLNDFELATRLSYFLWSSMPDDELEDLAAAGKLHAPAVLTAQVRRMLADAKSDAFVRNFVGQWLELRNLDASNPDPKVFPRFSGELKYAMRREAELFFGSVLREDQSVLRLVDADYTYVNGRLAKLYGIRNVTGDQLRRVSLSDTPAAGERGGVLTMAGVLTVTSMPARTSPVKRGKFVLQELLGDPPPPPPPNVPVLSNGRSGKSGLTLRQRLEQHRADSTCASCHARMDPLGFAMEHYDAIGRWRDKDNFQPIDSSGQLPGGQSVNGAAELKRLLLSRKQDFVRCLTEKMLTYALGRGLEDYDRPSVREIVQAADRDNDKAVSLILAIVNSDPFQKRRTGPPLKPAIAPATQPAVQKGSP